MLNLWGTVSAELSNYLLAQFQFQSNVPEHPNILNILKEETCLSKLACIFANVADRLIESCCFVDGLSDLLVPLFPTALSKGQREVTIPAGIPQYCFQDLSPDALYTATVFLQTPYLEGPGVDAKERTCESP